MPVSLKQALKNVRTPVRTPRSLVPVTATSIAPVLLLAGACTVHRHIVRARDTECIKVACLPARNEGTTIEHSDTYQVEVNPGLRT